MAVANRNVGTSGAVVRLGAASRSLSGVVASATRSDLADLQTVARVANTLCPPDEPCRDTIGPAEPEPVEPCDPVSCPGEPQATYTFGSDATAVSIISGTTLKTLRLSSFSQALTNVSTTTLDASFRNVGAATSCYNTAGEFDRSNASASGSPRFLEASRSPAWQGIIRWQVNGTHRFTPISGATGGGTFYSTDFTCG